VFALIGAQSGNRASGGCESLVEAEGIAPSSADNRVSVSTSVAPVLISQGKPPRSGLLALPAQNQIPCKVPSSPLQVSSLMTVTQG